MPNIFDAASEALAMLGVFIFVVGLFKAAARWWAARAMTHKAPPKRSPEK